MSGIVRDIAIAPTKRAPMERIGRAEVTVAGGIAGDARGHFPGRQITLLFEDDWNAACRDLGRRLEWTTRRANLLIAGLPTPRAGARLRVGEALLEATEETAPCQIMERAAKGLRAALSRDWRGGVCCRVLAGGAIEIGGVARIEG